MAIIKDKIAINGVIRVAGKLIFLDKGTSFKGTVTAKEVVIEGDVTGEIYASERISIGKDAVINGSIQTTRLLVEEGAKYNGSLRLGEKYKISNPDSEGLPKPSELKFDDWQNEKPVPSRSKTDEVVTNRDGSL